MGCSASKLEDEEAVQLCKDRKNFIKHAVEQRLQFASGHTAYLQSLRRVSVALRNYIEGDEHHDCFSDSSTPPLTPVKSIGPNIISIPLKSSPRKLVKSDLGTSNKVHYLRSSGNPSVSVEERPPQSQETARINSYYPMDHFGTDGYYFGMQSSPMNTSFFSSSSSSSSSPYNRPSFPPPPPQNSQWDVFWNPFSSLENYGYPSRTSLDHHQQQQQQQITSDDEMAGLRQVREEEGIPELEEEEEERQHYHHHYQQQQQQQQRDYHQQQQHQDYHHQQQQCYRQQQHQNYHQQQQQHYRQQQQQQHYRQQQQQQQEQPPPAKQQQQQHSRSEKLQGGRRELHFSSTRESQGRPHPAEVNVMKKDTTSQVKEFQSHVAEGVEKAENQKDFELVLGHDKEIMRNRGEPVKENTPGFTVYVNRRPGSMSEIMRDIENQFVRICDSAQEVSAMLEASRAQYSSTSNEITAIRMLNPVALFRSASSQSSSSRFLPSSSCSRDDNYETGSEFSEESCLMSGSHQSTLDRLYEWEKKLYEEVKGGERIRIAYEKKCTQLRSQDLNGEDPSSLEKTRTALRDLHTRIKISMHSIEAISRRIERLRDEELHPQLMKLIEGLARMWRTMADCHRIQKRAIDEAKLLLATPKLSEPPPPLIRLAHSATNLESELRNWRSCLEAWVTAQRAYVNSLASWLLRCASPPDPAVRLARSSLSPPRSSGAPPIFDICIQWSRLLDSVSEAQAVEGLDFFVAGIGSVIGQQREEAMAARRAAASGKEEVEEGIMMSSEKIAEVAIKVVCAGMSVAVSSLSDFSMCSMEGCEDVIRRFGDGGKDGMPWM